MIKGKLDRDTPDETCVKCHQEWKGECRAFELPHSEEEREQRLKGSGLCLKSINNKKEKQNGKRI